MNSRLLPKASFPVWTWLGLLGILLAIVSLLPGGLYVLAFLVSVLVLVISPGFLLAKAILRTTNPTMTALVGWGACLGVTLIAGLYSVAPLFDAPLFRSFWWGYALLALMINAFSLKGARFDMGAWLNSRWAPEPWARVLAVGVFAALCAKLGGVMGIANPPLHDPASHSLMAKLVVEMGYVPWYQLPFRASPFFYPPGLAALVAAFHEFSALEIPRLVLFWTNLSTVFAALAAYALIARLTGSPGAGVFAFGFLAFLSLMPSGEFYLAGKNSSVLSNFLFLGVVIVSYMLRDRPSISYGSLAGILLAGCFLFHYEKIIFLLVFFLAYALGSLWRARRVAGGPFLFAWLAAGLLSLILVTPWLYRLGWATAQAKLAGGALVPAAPSAFAGTALQPGAFWLALQSAWGPMQQYSDPSLVWMVLMAPLAVIFAPGVLDLLLFMLGIALFHPAVIEPLGFSMATLSYDRIVIHFAYLPICLLASMGLWAFWRVGTDRLSKGLVRRARLGLMGAATLLFVYGGVSQARHYLRIAANDALDEHDRAAFAWIARELPRNRSFVVPIPEGNPQRGHYFLQKAGLYLPVYSGHDVMGHFIRIETPQIEREYRQYLAMLGEVPAGFQASNYWFYTRNDDPYYDPLNLWLAAQPAGHFHERYRNDHVRVLELATGKGIVR